ncbi:Hypothetical protein IALB_0326 [Ignavibacterium album JCM 16511]|uniref:Uncharacterized protein n=1 Tax=Ignavibacterium album (strain DSM 19864 / JCM 16511 / NBRC 101810 / Mat9-16) TaxID=945713 RepID=I0AGD1_IGNAJ|nr:hypothetical protein [Ignavibacterium album]AFH48038.1 Hypothetical protein IALB_0326 [Ignavibacterium album JCM 16511]
MREHITEKDLFDFVFFPTMLSKEKFSYLENSGDFQDELAFFTELKKSLQTELTQQQKQLIAEKIPAYKLLNIIELYPVEQKNKRKVNGLILAAASENNNKPKVTSRTFYDDNKTYIIKVINYENTSKIFVFSTQYEVIKNFDLIISPQNLRYHIDDNTIPLELDFNVNPESIRLEFSLVKQS